MNGKRITIRIKRVYEEPEEADGRRVLVDRLWTRGLSKEKAKVDVWVKEIAPSTELRRRRDWKRGSESFLSFPSIRPRRTGIKMKTENAAA